MASFLFYTFPFHFFFFFLHLKLSIANIHKSNALLNSRPFLSLPTITPSADDTPPPTLYFEVTKPIKTPNSKPCVHTVLHHDFAYTYTKPPVITAYSPPSHCPFQRFSTIVLDWSATCKGRQFDRIFGVWLGGVELLRSCTAEPTTTGIVWNVQKDITRYYSLLVKNETQELAVYLGNVVDSTYTGVYHVNITLYFYPADKEVIGIQKMFENLVSGNDFKADLILPISRDLPLNDGLWFEIENSTDIQGKEFWVPENVYRAVLEIYVSFHENDEFWYGNYPNEYIVANNLSGTPGNGPFREVVVSVDGVVVGAVWPFTVVYTGGINPLLWRPITGIGSFNLPSYDIELTPFLEKIKDGKMHKLGFSVTNGLNVWYVDANLHLWLDHENEKTEAKLLNYDSPPLALSTVLNFKGLNGSFLTMARRSVFVCGWVKSSHGKISTCVTQYLSYYNSMEMRNEGNLQIVDQTVDFNESVFFKEMPSGAHQSESSKKFHIYMYSNYMDQGNESAYYITNITLGYNVDNSHNAGIGFVTSSLKNQQDGQGVMVVRNNLVVSGSASTQQVYRYNSCKFCYFRNVSATNYDITYDQVGNTCNKRKQSCPGFWLNRLKSPLQGNFPSIGLNINPLDSQGNLLNTA